MLKAKQKERIIEYMRDNGSITPAEAFGELGITKLSTRVGELIDDGYDIHKVWEHDINRYGEKTHYMRYFLRSDRATA